jgi:hypothetical protein
METDAGAAMSEQAILRAAGLHTVANNLESVPNGAFATLDNCVIRSKDIVESRRGQKLATSYSAFNRLRQVLFYNGSILATHASGSLAKDTGSAWTDYNNPSGYTANPNSYRLKSAQAAGRLYLATANGPVRLNALTSTALERAGVGYLFQGWHSSGPLASSVGFLYPNKAVAYRCVRVRVDPLKKEIVGPPSSRLIIRNPAAVAIAIGSLSRSGTTVTATTTSAHGYKVGQVLALTPGEANFASGNKTVVSVTATTFTYTEAGSATTNTAEQTLQIGRAYVTAPISLDDDAAVGDIVRVYRSENTAAWDDNPLDEMYLAYETVLTAGNVAAGLIAFADYAPDVFLGDPAYFSPSREGLLQANEEPPLCDDIATFDDALWFGNCEERATLEVDLLVTGGSLGLQAGDVISFRPDGGTTVALTAGTDFAVYTGGDQADDIERTAQAIVQALNEHASNTLIRAEYFSGFDDAPGRILLTHRQLTASSLIYVWASAHGTAWNPVLPTTQGDVNGKGFERPNWVMRSKPGQPDAVPAMNFIPVGDEDDAILRIVPLNDKLYVLKQRSVWVIAGPAPYSCYRLGGKLETIAPDSAAVLQDRLYVLTTQGVMAISDGGFDFVGLPIELDITSLFGSALASVNALGMGIAYESERCYLLGLPTTTASLSGDGTHRCTQWFVYSVMTGTWTRWPITRYAGGVNPANDTLYMSDAEEQKLFVERKTYDETDYSDTETTVSISAINGSVLTINSAPTVGDAITQGSAKSLVTAVAGAGPTWTATVQSATGFTVASATLLAGISCTVKWQSLHMGEPDKLKHLQGLKLLFRQMAFRLATLTVGTEQVTTAATAKTLARASYALGFTGELGPRNEHALIPSEHGRACYFNVTFAIREARARWKLQGLVAKFDVSSEREPRT